MLLWWNENICDSFFFLAAVAPPKQNRVLHLILSFHFIWAHHMETQIFYYSFFGGEQHDLTLKTHIECAQKYEHLLAFEPNRTEWNGNSSKLIWTEMSWGLKINANVNFSIQTFSNHHYYWCAVKVAFPLFCRSRIMLWLSTSDKRYNGFTSVNPLWNCLMKTMKKKNP